VHVHVVTCYSGILHDSFENGFFWNLLCNSCFSFVGGRGCGEGREEDWKQALSLLCVVAEELCICFQGKKIKCSSSQAKHKLFIGNVPKTWGEEDLRKVVTKVGPGVTTIELLKV